MSTSTMASSRPEATPAETAHVADLSWAETDAVRSLRLVLADASLRARAETRRYLRGSQMHDEARGRAQGFADAVRILRGWSHPDHRERVLATLRAWTRRAHAQAGTHMGAATAMYYTAYAWAIGWVLDAVREQCISGESLPDPERAESGAPS